MKTINELKKRRAVSPVIATVILVAITITVAVAVAYWMSGIAGQYTQFEKIEIQTGYAENVASVDPDIYDAAHPDAIVDPSLIGEPIPGTGSPAGWTITLVLKNSGTTSSTLINCFINDKLIGQTGGSLEFVTCDGLGGGAIGLNLDGIKIESGSSETITIAGLTTAFSSSGTTLNVKLHSAAGMDYIRLVQLP